MSATLPFDQDVEILGAPSGDHIASVRGRIWPGTGVPGPRGEVYDATGEIEPDAAEYLVRQGNRRLVVEGVTYSVQSAVFHSFLPHVEVGLSELRPAG